MKKVVVPLVAAMCSFALAQDDARSVYQTQRAIQEVQRLSSQFDQMESRMEQLSSRMGRIEGSSSARDVKAEIGALRSELDQLKRRQAAMHDEIVREISAKMAALLKERQPAAQPSRGGDAPRSGRSGRAQQTEAAESGPTGPYFEHIVEKGETLSYIAKECNTTVQKIKQYSGLKSDSLRIGQKILIPAEEEKKK